MEIDGDNVLAPSFWAKSVVAAAVWRLSRCVAATCAICVGGWKNVDVTELLAILNVGVMSNNCGLTGAGTIGEAVMVSSLAMPVACLSNVLISNVAVDSPFICPDDTELLKVGWRRGKPVDITGKVAVSNAVAVEKLALNVDIVTAVGT